VAYSVSAAAVVVMVELCSLQRLAKDKMAVAKGEYDDREGVWFAPLGRPPVADMAALCSGN
jgi:hypothetical protein